MTGLREFMETRQGKGIAIGLCLVALVAIIFSVKRNLGQSEAAALSRDRIYICSETGKTFGHELRVGEKQPPIYSPHSEKQTGYPAEICYWTADGGIKKEPTYVLLNTYAGQPEPTFCPDCGRLVVVMNSPAIPGQPPPPTRAEYTTRSPVEGY